MIILLQKGVLKITRLVLLFALAFVFESNAKPIIHHKFVLPNQLEVVVVPNEHSRAVSHMLLFKAGAADDPRGASGVAHYLEHLLFKGTPKYPEGEYSRIIERLGGEHNAFTSSDMTAYYVIIDSKHLPKVMELEADRMQHYSPSNAAYEKERDVILEERRLRTDNNPHALMNEAINMAAFPHHPYGTPIIGFEHEMRLLDKNKARAFFQQYYNPANAVLMLIGDVDLQTAKNLAYKYYGNWKAGIKQVRDWVSDPTKNAQNLIVMYNKNVKQSEISINYPAPSFKVADNQSEVYALLLAEELLGNQRTGWLYQRLVQEQKLASHISVSYYPFSIGSTIFSVRAVPNAGITPQKLQSAVQKELDNFANSEIVADDLLRAKNQMKAATLYAQDSLYAMSFFLATLYMTDISVDWFNNYSNEITKIETKQVKESLQKYINHEIAVAGYLLQKK
jgi:zinc protease